MSAMELPAAGSRGVGGELPWEALLPQVSSLLFEARRTLLINSPPGAGKTELATRLVCEALSEHKLRVAVVTPRAWQMYDVARRLAMALAGTGQSIQLLYAKGRELPLDLRESEPVVVRATSVLELLPGSSVVVSTAAKLLNSVIRLARNEFDLIICDEAYQLMFKDCAPLFKLSPTFCLIGDPGQLPPTVKGVDTSLFEANSARVHWSLPKELLRRFPLMPLLQMPLSMRLVADTVELIQPALYPSLVFKSAVRTEDRRVTFNLPSDGGPIDEALDLLASGASVIGILLPSRRLYLDEADLEVANLGAEVVARLLQRGVRWEGVRTLTPDDVGYIDAHIVSGAATRRALRRFDIPGGRFGQIHPRYTRGVRGQL